jgi:hypothetical protein
VELLELGLLLRDGSRERLDLLLGVLDLLRERGNGPRDAAELRFALLDLARVDDTGA